MRTFFLNGKFVKESQAKVNIENLGILRGYGVFDYITTYNKIPFHLDDHLSRFFKSAKTVGLEVPYNKSHVKKIIISLIKKNSHLEKLSFRLILFGGKTFDGKTSNKENFAIIVSKPHLPEKELYQKGIKIMTVDYVREMPKVKSINYLVAISNWEKAVRNGYKEILYKRNNKVYECSTSDFLFIKNKKLRIAKDRILKGVTAKIVMGLAKRIGISVEEGDVLFSQVLSADEAFIAATDKEILPVVKIDRFKIADGKVGFLTKKLISQFQEYKERYLKKYSLKNV